jgi:hypothetical protein
MAVLKSSTRRGKLAIGFLPTGGKKNKGKISIKQVNDAVNGTVSTESWPFHKVCLDPFDEGIKAAEYISG